MTLIEHRRGSRNVYHFDLIDDHDQIVDSTGVTGELRVSVQETCIVLSIDEGMDVDLQPLSAAAGDYVAALYLDWGSGMSFEGELMIRISEGC